jgi:hypothetical protein
VDNRSYPALVATLRRLACSARKGALATLRADGGGPHASLVLVAIEADLAPVLLLSSLARHTRNAHSDPRVSLLIDGTGGEGDPMTGPRASFEGRLAVTTQSADRAAFLARHPAAAAYADFADFAFFRLTASHAYLIEGFGRIHELSLTAAVRNDPAG